MHELTGAKNFFWRELLSELAVLVLGACLIDLTLSGGIMKSGDWAFFKKSEE